MSRPFVAGRLLREDLADQINWYRHEKQVADSVVDGFFEAYDRLCRKLCDWPESGRTVEGPIAGLQEANLPKPYQHYVLLFLGNDREVTGLRLFGSAEEREVVIRRYRDDPDAMESLR